MSMGKSNSGSRRTFTAYFTYLTIAGMIASAMFVANNLFYPLFLIVLLCVSLTFAITFIYRDRIAKTPWKCLSVFMLLFLLAMLSLVFVLMRNQ